MPVLDAGCSYMRRSEFVRSSFDPALLNGMWYEQAYTDIAQVGSKCQTLNSSLLPSGQINMAFRVDYG